MVTYDWVHLSVTLGLLFHTVKIVYPMREMSDQVPGGKTHIMIVGLTLTHRPALDPRVWIKVLAPAL